MLYIDATYLKLFRFSHTLSDIFLEIAEIHGSDKNCILSSNSFNIGSVNLSYT
jgi:hypothetical protein